jgi:thiamine-monophosphate kinase
MPDELEVIEIIKGRLASLPRGYSPIGDDAALIPVKGKRLMVKSDMLVGKTDIPRGMTYREAARKAVASCVSDFAAKGVAPDSFLVSLGLTRGISEKDVRDLAGGFADSAREWKINLVGGDTNEADDLIIDCTMIGFGGDFTRRSGAKAGDLVVTSGEFGLSSAGLKILLEGAKAEPGFRRVAVGRVLKPNPRLRLGLAVSKYLTASIDSSDGLATCLHSIAKLSGVGMTLSRLPFGRGVEKFARMNGYSAEELVLYGGEEYEIVGTSGRKAYSRASIAARSLREELLVIGRTTKESGVRLLTGNEERLVEDRGWVHLS